MDTGPDLNRQALSQLPILLGTHGGLVGLAQAINLVSGNPILVSRQANRPYPAFSYPTPGRRNVDTEHLGELLQY